MPTLDRAKQFAEEHLTAPDGTPFSFVGRDWLMRELWLPFYGAKFWPVNRDRLCDACAIKAGTFTANHNAADETRTEEHAESGCDGLTCEQQILIFIYLKRQSGKTVGVKGTLLPLIFLDEKESVVMLAGSEDQAKRLYDEHYKRQVETSEALADHANVLGTKITTDTGSELLIVPTTTSAVGGTHTVVVIDECRIVPADIGPKMALALASRGGRHCPLYHMKTHLGVDDPSAPKTCPVCGRPTVEWHGRAVMMSSAGELKDTDSDWFHLLCVKLLENPSANVHVFMSTDTLNPKVSAKAMSTIERTFSEIEETRTYVEIEAGNRAMKRGEPFMSETDIKRSIDKRIVNLTSCSAPSFGFLDTSDTTDKTSLVILSDLAVARGAEPWDEVTQTRLDVWIPKETTAGVIDSAAVEAHLENIMAMFTGLVKLKIDTRGRPWAIAMFNRLRRKSAKLARYDKTDRSERNAGFGKLWQRMVTRPNPKIILQDHSEQTRELKFARKKRSADGEMVVCDPNTNREKYHLDITESVAMCCYMIAEHQMKQAASGGMAAIQRAVNNVVRHATRRDHGTQGTANRQRAGGAPRRAGGQGFHGEWY